MMDKMKLTQTLILVFLVFGIPSFLAQSHQSLWPVAWVACFGFLLNITGPKMDLLAGFKKTRTDGLSMLIIVFAGILGFLIPTIDYLFFRQSFTADISFFIGSSLAVFGLVFRIYSIRVLGRFFTARVEIKNDHELIRTGPYRMIRHPSYLGAWIMYLGTSIILQSLVGFIFCAVSFFLAYSYRTKIEEQSLGEQLGSAYTAYQSETWKMIPYVF